MIALDTNIIARVFLDDHAKESRLASSLMEKVGARERLFIALPVIIELVWVLSRRGIPRAEIHQRLSQLVETDGVVIGQRDLVIEALSLYRLGKADFADYVIMCESSQSGARAMATFDQDLYKEQTDYCQHPRAFA